MDFVYPLDVKKLLEHAHARGDDFLRTVGLDRDLRDDLVLGRVATRATTGWFPYNRDHRWHGALDIGFADHGDDTLVGMPVRAIAAGTVVYEDGVVHDAQDRCQGRLIVKHEKDGKCFYVQYKHLRSVKLCESAEVKAGDVLGELGPHDGLPHLELAVVSQDRLGGEDLAPEIEYEPVTPLNPAWEALRVRVRRLDPFEWPIRALGFEEGFLYSPIEFIRFCLGEQALPDAGPASTHGVKLTPWALSFALGAAADHRLEASTTFRYPSLRVKAIEELGRDFKPVFEKGDKRAEAVKAIQLALRDAGFPILPATGAYGGKTEDAVKTFQRDKLKPMLRNGPANVIPGKKESDVQVDGKVDWLTLTGLDIYASAHAKAPAAKGSGEKAPKEPPRPIEPAKPVNTFDGSKGLSIHIGVRMIKAMLAWLWNGTWDGTKIVPLDPKRPLGVGYSSCNDVHYGDATRIAEGKAVIDKYYYGHPEWPNIGIDEAWKATGSLMHEGTSERIYKAFARSWCATGFSNCCNTLMAALSVALGGTSFGVKGGKEFGETRGGEVSNYDITNPEEPKLLRYYQGKLQQKRSAMQIFGDMFASSGPWESYKTADGTPIGDTKYGGHVNAIAAIGAGEMLAPFSSKPPPQDTLRKLRIGDIAASYNPDTKGGHAFVIGDVRYTIWVRQPPPPPEAEPTQGGKKNLKKKPPPPLPPPDPGPHYFLDQSSFVRAEKGVLVSLKGTVNTPYRRRKTQGQPLLSASDCDELLKEETETSFLHRVDAFLSLKPGDTFGEQVIEKIEVDCYRVFSANARTDTAHSLPYLYDEGDGTLTLKSDQMLANEQGPSYHTLREAVEASGVSAPWNIHPMLSFGRFYAPLART